MFLVAVNISFSQLILSHVFQQLDSPSVHVRTENISAVLESNLSQPCHQMSIPASKHNYIINVLISNEYQSRQAVL